MERFLQSLLNVEVVLALLLFGGLVGSIILGWIGRQLSIFVGANRRASVRIGLLYLLLASFTAIPKENRRNTGTVSMERTETVALSTGEDMSGTDEAGTGEALGFSAISVGAGGVDLGVVWSPQLFIPGGTFGLYATDDLAGPWSFLGAVSVPRDMTNAVFSVQGEALSALEPRRAFFKIGTLRDSDGDGLADVYERIVSCTDPLRVDTDGDGRTDFEELCGDVRSDPLLSDTDGDGIPDHVEVEAEMDPSALDTDGDGLLDFDEMTQYGTNPLARDTDGDGLCDAEEIARGTDPRQADTDFDGLNDGDEIAAGTDPLVRDSDGDGLLDGEEVERGTDPLCADTDGDGVSDFDEYDGASDPLDAGSVPDDGNVEPPLPPSPHQNPRPVDTDGDGMPDAWEEQHGLNPASPEDAEFDPDHDGLTNREEFLLGTDPNDGDTDGDGLTDGQEAPTVSTGSGAPLPFENFLEHEGRNIVVYTNVSQMAQRYVLTTPVVQFGNTFTSFSIDSKGVFHLHSEATGAYVQTGRENVDLEVRKVSDGVLTVAPCWADLEFTTQSVVRVCEFVEDCVVVDYVRLYLSGRPRVPENEVTVQALIPFNQDPHGLQGGIEVLFGTIGTNVAQVASIGFRMPGGRVRKTYSHRGTRALRSGSWVYFAPATGTDPARADTDADGLGDGEEIETGTDPLDPDTDGDGMLDGWELEYSEDGFDPLADQSLDGDVDLRPGADPDGDGLTNVEESRLGTDPFTWTAYEGAPDEDRAGRSRTRTVDSDSEKPVRVDFTFGDDSGSHSEKYRLRVTPLSEGKGYEWVDARFGVCETKAALLLPNTLYTVQLSHYATKEDEWDFDYRLDCRAPEGYGVVVDDPEGLLGVHSDRGEGRSFADSGKIARIGVVRMGIYADYDRINGVDDGDLSVRKKAGPKGTLYHWVNDNRSPDGGWNAVADLMAWGCGDARRNNCVDGVCDTLDFTPVWLDFGDALGFLDDLGVPFEFRLSQPDAAVNAVWTSQKRTAAGAFVTANISGCGPHLDQDVIAATTTRATRRGAVVPDGFQDLVRSDSTHGVVLLEGRRTSTAPLTLSCVRTDTGATLSSVDLPMRISQVGDMFRWVNIWNAVDGSVTTSETPPSPIGLPDDACGSDWFVFVHGYNMNLAESDAWAGEFFKRLRQSGSSAKFVGVAWKGNYSQCWLPVKGNVSANYYYNVRNAFLSSSALAREVGKLTGGSRFIAAHSLGNMLVSAAIADWGMSYAYYFMLNAAVPLEAYVPSSATDASRAVMTPEDWRAYPLRVRASRWNERFAADDPRRTLTWRGRFGELANVVNYYSSEDEVLKNGDGTDQWPVQRDYAWYNQERGKGRGLTGFMSEAGWGFNSEHDLLRRRRQTIHGADQDVVYYSHRTPTETAELSDEQLRKVPFFGHFDNRDIYTHPELATGYAYRASLLSRAIPAESFATGSNPVPGWPERKGVRKNVKMVDLKDEKNEGLVGETTWDHTFFIKAPYPYVHKLYDEMKEFL